MPDDHPDLGERLREVLVEVVGESGFLPVLVLLAASTVCALLIGDSHLGALLSIALTGAALLTTVFRSTKNRVARIATLVFCLLVAVVVNIGPRTDERLGWVALTGYIVIEAAALPLVLIRALEHRRVTINTLTATVSAYLLLGLLFAGIFRLYGSVAPPFFAHAPGPGECDARPLPEACPTAGEYSYFSFITLATVGYGDFVPASDPARAFVTLEAITGQVFVITVLARVVSLLGAERAPRPRPDD